MIVGVVLNKSTAADLTAKTQTTTKYMSALNTIPIFV